MYFWGKILFFLLIPISLGIFAYYRVATSTVFGIPKERCLIADTVFGTLTGLIHLKYLFSQAVIPRFDINADQRNISIELRIYQEFLTYFPLNWITDNLLTSDDDFLFAFKRYFNSVGCYVPPTPTCQLTSDLILAQSFNDQSDWLPFSPVDTDVVWVDDRENRDIDDKWIVFVHGGAYRFGGGSHFGMACALSRMSGLPIAFVNYSLEADVLIPYQVTQALTVYTYLQTHRNVNYDNIVMAGDSAGGHISLLTAQKLAAFLQSPQSEEIKSLGQMRGLSLFSPNVDITMSGQSWITNAQYDDVVQSSYVRRVLQMATNRSDLSTVTDASISAIHGSFTNMPQNVYILVSAHETLLSENEALYEKFKSSDANDWKSHGDYINSESNQLWFVVKPYMVHAWVDLIGIFPEAEISLQEAATNIADWLA